MAAAHCPEVTAIIEIVGAEHKRCKAEGVERDAGLVRSMAAGQAELDRRWPGVWEIDGQLDEQGRLAFMVSRRDRPRYPRVVYDDATGEFVEDPV